MKSLEECVDPDQISVHPSFPCPEQEKSPVAKFLLNLTELNIYIGLQAVLDSLDIWLSAIKYVFDALNPSSGNRSAAEMYRWLHSSEGLLIFILGGVFIALFSFCGNYVDTKKKGNKPWLIQEFAKLADATWPYLRDSFKGLKWTFKGMRSFLLVAQLLANQNMVHLITPLGIALGVVAALNRAWSRGMVERRKVVQSNNDGFREHVKFLNVAFAELGAKWKDNFEHLDDHFKRIYQGSVLKIGKNFFYVDENLKLQELSLSFKPTLGTQIDIFHYKKYLETCNESDRVELSRILKIKEDYLKRISNATTDEAKSFYDFPKYQVDGKQAYASALLNGVLNAPYYFLGVLSLYLDVIPATIFPYAIVICGLFMVLNVVAELYQEFDYQRRLSISQNKAKLSMIKRLIRHEWDKINQLIDSQFITEPAKDSEEFKNVFIKILHKLCIEAEASESESLKDPVYINYINKLKSTYPEVNDTLHCRFTKEQKNELTACLERLSSYSKDFDEYKSTLRRHLVLDRQATFMQGIKNGLHIYGVFNGCLIALSTMAFLAGFNLGIVFLYISIACGITFVTLSTIFTMVLTKNAQPAGGTLTPSGSNSDLSIVSSSSTTSDLSTNALNHGEIWMPDDVQKKLNELDIQPSRNLMISEQCEVFRQFMSGSKKGVKLLQTILMLAVGTSTDIEVSEKLLYGAVALTYGGLFSLKGLRGLMRVDNHDYEKSTLVGGFFSKQETKKTLSRTPSISNFHTAFA